MIKKQSLRLLLSCLLATAIIGIPAAGSADGKTNVIAEHAVVFLLDASNSMNTHDPNRLAIDSIAQLIYSLPSNYEVGFVAYNTELAAETPLVDSGHRREMMAAAETIRYVGYTNAGVGLTRALEFLEATQAADKAIVILSDGEIVLQNAQSTIEASSQFQAAVTTAEKEGIRIHVIGLGQDMEDRENTIFSASSSTGGTNFHVPKAANIQNVVDSLLVDHFKVQKTTAAIVNASGQEESLTVDLPSNHAARVRILLTSTSPIQNLKTDFTAYGGEQVNGVHYALLELAQPASKEVNLSFQGKAESKIKVDVITEYAVTARVEIHYSDTVPEDPEAVAYQREAGLHLMFYDRENPNQQIFTDAVFDRLPIPLIVNNQKVEGALQDGSVSFTWTVSGEEPLAIYYDLSTLPVNILATDPVRLTLEAPPLLPERDWTPYYVGGGLLALVVAAAVALAQGRRKKRPQAIPESPPPPASKFSYSGRLSIYITRTPSGYDIPPLTYNLFRLSPSRVLSLQDILDECNVDERFEGAGQIFFKSGANRSLVLTNNSDCTVMQNREILMKNRSYQISQDSKLDITFEDEVSELVLQYRDVKPSEMRMTAGVC